MLALYRPNILIMDKTSPVKMASQVACHCPGRSPIRLWLTSWMSSRHRLTFHSVNQTTATDTSTHRLDTFRRTFTARIMSSKVDCC